MRSDDVCRVLSTFWSATPKTVTVFSQGVNQSVRHRQGQRDHQLPSRDRPHRPARHGPFSLTGQPNAMGGREVGGLANQLAAHMDFEDPGRPRPRARFWNAPRIATQPGLKAVDLFDARRDGPDQGVWIMATNPVVSLPEADAVAAALERCELVVVSGLLRDTDTTRRAHVLLPALAWGEKDGTVTNSERRISRQRAFLPPPARRARLVDRRASRPAHGFRPRRFDYDIAGRRSSASTPRSPAFENGGGRDFDIGALAGLDDAEYDARSVPMAGAGARSRGCSPTAASSRRRPRARMIADAAGRVERRRVPAGRSTPAASATSGTR